MTDIHLLQWFAMSTRGPVRRVNEDSVQYHPDDYMLAERPDFIPPEGQLCVVADGMGGLQGGKQASNMAVKIIIRSYYTQQNLPPDQSIREAIQQAHHNIIQVMRQTPELERMGTTVVLAANQGNQTWIANVGDSRAYLWRHQTLTPLSYDDRWVAAQVREHILTEEQARHHEYRNVLNQHLGSEKEIVPHLTNVQLQAEDRLLLCTDGLFDFLSDDEIRRILAHPPDKAVRKLMKLALDRGSNDNITVAIGYYHSARKASHGFFYDLVSKIGLVLLTLIIIVAAILLLLPSISHFSLLDTAPADYEPERQQEVAMVGIEDLAAFSSPTPSPTPSPVPTATIAPTPIIAVVSETVKAIDISFPRIEIDEIEPQENDEGLDDEEKDVYKKCVQSRDSNGHSELSYLIFTNEISATKIMFTGLTDDIVIEADSKVDTECHATRPITNSQRIGVDSGSTVVTRAYTFDANTIYRVRYTNTPIRVFGTDEAIKKKAATREEQQAFYDCPNISSGTDDALVIFSAPPGTSASFKGDEGDEKDAIHLYEDVARCEKIDSRATSVSMQAAQTQTQTYPIELKSAELYIVRYERNDKPPQ